MIVSMCGCRWGFFAHTSRRHLLITCCSFSTTKVSAILIVHTCMLFVRTVAE